MLLTDGTHLVSDISLEELHRFAASIGLKRRWFQGDHYDLTTVRARHRALRNGVKQVTSREIVLRMAGKGDTHDAISGMANGEGSGEGSVRCV